jgi:hypothetical protein
MYSSIIAPVVALVAWTLVMMVWMYATRLPAMRRAGLLGTDKRGTRPGELDGALPDAAQWKAHNYNHLMEQPTLFYAICLAIAHLGGGDVWINLALAWAYVGLRIVHSLIQATVNVVALRFLVFALASFCLIGLTVHAAARVIHAGF